MSMPCADPFMPPGLRKSDKDRAIEVARRVLTTDRGDVEKVLLSRELLRALALTER